MLRIRRQPPLVSPAPAKWVGGFSLVEVIVVIAILGVLSGVFIGWYATYHRDVIEKVTHQRNAQEIVSIGVCATMGGADFIVPDDKQATIENLITGTIGQTGLWKGKTFRLTSLNPETLPGALEYVKFDANLLLYEPAGGQ
jgi:prepilin-type N-terminal cleavage/methylation domain-containing protein